jgi:hypothetical protein
MEWLGHVIKTEDTGITKRISNAKPEDICGVGSQKVEMVK